MGACIRYTPPPAPIAITVPGGAKLTSQAENTHDPCGPFGNLFQISAPIFGAITPSFDIVNFVMVLVDFLLCILALLGALLAISGNPALATMFPLPTIRNTNDNEPIPGYLKDEDTGIPDVKCAVDQAILLLCRTLKLVGLVPQLSMIVTIKDSLNALLALLSCIQAKFNSLSDAASLIPQATGDPIIDAELDCAREAMNDYFAHAAGPLTNVIPVFQLLGKLAEPVQQGLPPSVANIITIAVNLGLIPFPNSTAKTQFLDLIEELKNGTLIQIPDLTNISDIPATMNDIRTKLEPVLGAIEQVQKLTEKLQNC